MALRSRVLRAWLFVMALGCETTREDAAPPAAPAPPASAPALAASAPTASLEVPQAPPSYRLPVPPPAESAPAKRYASISRATCSVTLRERALPFSPARGKSSGIEMPLALDGPINGVRFELPRSTHGFVDCRLALLMDDLAMELAALGVSSVAVNNTYRPGARIKRGLPTKPSGKRAAARRSAARGGRLSQHAHGLALDISEFRLTDGRSLNIERDFHATRGAPPCGPESRVGSDDPAATALRNITCALARGAYCNHLITPNHNDDHADHLHCDLDANAREVSVY